LDAAFNNRTLPLCGFDIVAADLGDAAAALTARQVDHFNTTRDPTCDAHILDMGADNLAAVGDHHQAVFIHHRETSDQRTSGGTDYCGSDAFSAARGRAVSVGRGALTKALG